MSNKSLSLFILGFITIARVTNAQPNGIEVGWSEKEFLSKFERYKHSKVDDSTYRVPDLKWIQSKGHLYVNLDTNGNVKSWSWLIKEIGGKKALVKIVSALDKKYDKGGKLYENEDDRIYWSKKGHLLCLDFTDPSEISLDCVLLK